uniref:NAD(+) ADP-ribosyltransferase n=1 Tax=Glossina palpalis gambiensis TaxID=67801 RepID=A0A1B0C5C8_9MUSC
MYAIASMMEFDLDMEKMPLAKLSQKQIQSAYKSLTEVYGLIQESGIFMYATNRFNTLRSHNFRSQSPPLFDTIEQIEKLCEIRRSLHLANCHSRPTILRERHVPQRKQGDPPDMSIYCDRI